MTFDYYDFQKKFANLYIFLFNLNFYICLFSCKANVSCSLRMTYRQTILTLELSRLFSQMPIQLLQCLIKTL